MKPLALIALVYLTITCWNLHLQTISNPDEPRFACPARSMIRDDFAGGLPGETRPVPRWIVPVFNGEVRLVKPILLYWLIAATGMAGERLGLDLAMAMRMGPVLMGLLAVMGIFTLGRMLVSPRCGILAAAILSTSFLFHETARQLVVDMPLAAFVAWSWVFCWMALQRLCGVGVHARPTGPLLGFYLCLALACMTKGPVLVALFVVLPLLAFLFASGRLRDLKRVGLWWGLPLSLGLGCAWFLYVNQIGYQKEMNAFLLVENVGRAGGKKDHYHPIPFAYYFGKMGESFLPWIFLLPATIWWTVRRFRECALPPSPPPLKPPAPPSNAAAKFLFCALAVPFLILGLSMSKRDLYLVPLYPYLALWVAWSWERGFLAREGSALSRRLILGLAVFGVAVLAAGTVVVASRDASRYVTRSDLGLIVVLGLALCAAMAVAARHLLAGRRLRGTGHVLAAACALCIGYESILRPLRERAENRVEFYRNAGQALAGKPFVMLGESSNEAVWFVDRPLEKLDDIKRPQLEVRFFEAHKKDGTLLLIERKQLDIPPAFGMAVVRVESKPLVRAAEEYIIVKPHPVNKPDASIFKPQGKNAAEQKDE